MRQSKQIENFDIYEEVCLVRLDGIEDTKELRRKLILLRVETDTIKTICILLFLLQIVTFGIVFIDFVL
jgi:hypothetical protein